MRRKNINKMRNTFFVFTVLVCLYGCQPNRWDINIESIQINQEFKRFDKDLFDLDIDSIWNKIPEFEANYGRFFEIYNTHVIRIGGTNQLDYDDKLAYFLSDPDIGDAYNDAQKLYGTLPFEKDINNAFKRFNYYFPNEKIPDVYAHISGFNQSIVLDSNYISISLDKYLGSKSKYYQMLRTPNYKRVNMHPEKISSDVMFAWCESEFVYDDTHENLITQMIYFGKIHIFLDAMLPNTADSLKWGFSSQQLDWCDKNERQMWVYLVENKLLFTSAFKELNKYINDGPFTSTFSQESPSRSGRWLGYKIIQSYLKHNPKITLPELMKNTNYQEILNQSKYKP